MDDAILCYIDGIRTRAGGDVVLTLSVDQTQAAKFQRFLPLVGSPIGVAFAEIGKEIQERPRLYGQQAKILKLSSFFRTPEVWKAIGTDKQFRAWIQMQPSALSSYFDETDKGPRCEAAHVRRAGESGTGYKADYACIPLTHEEHEYQHQHGEKAAFEKYMPGELLAKSIDSEKAWFDRQRIFYVSKWAWDELKRQLGFDSWAEIPPNTLKTWADKHELTLPSDYY